MEQKNSQTWSWGAPTVAGGRAKTECGCQKWFGRSACYMKSKCAFNFSCPECFFVPPYSNLQHLPARDRLPAVPSIQSFDSVRRAMLDLLLSLLVGFWLHAQSIPFYSKEVYIRINGRCYSRHRQILNFQYQHCSIIRRKIQILKIFRN